MHNDAHIPGPLTHAQLREFADAAESGVLPLNRFTPVLAKSLIVKPEQGKLYGFTVTSTNVAAQFVQVFDAGALPADGVVPLMALNVAAGSSVSAYFGSVGRAFEQGIVICNSTTQGTKTIGAADCIIDAQYV